MPNGRSHNKKRASTDETLLGVEVTVGAEQSFCDILLEAIDEAFSSLGESVKEAMYFHLEKTFQIGRREVPFRIEDFSYAIERIFGLGARHLEVLFTEKLHAKAKTEHKWDLPKWEAQELTFKDYILSVKQNFE